EDHVVFGGDEVQRSEVGDQVAFEAAGVVEVELLQRFGGWEAGGADAALAAVGFAGGDLALQAGDEELLVRPGLSPGPFSEALDRLPQGWCLQRPGQEGDLCGEIPGCPARGHHATPPSRGPSALLW